MTLDEWAQILKASTGAPKVPRRVTASVSPVPSVGAAANGHQHLSAEPTSDRPVRHHPTATELLETPCALLTRTHLRELGLERRAVDAVFRKLPIVSLPGYSRPMIQVDQYLELIRQNTYRDDRVRPSHA
jgi:hypothetical protein